MINEILKPIQNKNSTILSKNDEEFFFKIISQLRSSTGADFSNYKRETIIRRLKKRTMINQIDDYSQYYQYLTQTPEEVEALYRDLLISVTHFFRDPPAYELLKTKVIPNIMENLKKEKTVRVWVVGCSTGEEAYSLAILFKEYMENVKEVYEIKIFATDIDKWALNFASQGRYNEDIIAEISRERLNRYFTKKDQYYKINESIRKMIAFAPQNVIQDPPFSRIDLISCRNLLIYLQSETQKKVINSFHFALNEKGFLFLGSSESIGNQVNLFSVLDTKWKIFQYKGAPKPPLKNETTFRPQVEYYNRFSQRTTRFDRNYPNLDTLFEVQNFIFKNFLPPTVIINEEFEIIQILNDVNHFLTIPSGVFKRNIIEMTRSEISTQMSNILHRVVKERTPIIYNRISIKEKENTLIFNIKATPFENSKTHAHLICISFENAESHKQSPQEAEIYNSNSLMNQEMSDLRQDLQQTRENLYSSIEELEIANEEAQSYNEELVASNEELQSTNEELQSTNEELHSVNEELRTVNIEYQEKIEELTQLHNDINNILLNTGIGIIFLDKNLKIRKFTPLPPDDFPLIESDLGRPISDIALNLNYDSLYADIKEMSEDMKGKEIEIQSRNNNWYLLRIYPYKYLKDDYGGIVLSFININSKKRGANNDS